MSAPTSPDRTPRLQIDDTLGRRVVVIDKPVFRIGRKSESDVRPVSVDVSREHAEIVRHDDGAFVLRDRGSRYGTFVNDERVTERPLKHRDRIRLGRSGNAELIFLLGDAIDSTLSPSSGIVDFRQISTLLDSLRAMGSARVLDEVLELVMDAAIDATGAERGFIMLATPARDLEFMIGRAKGRVTLSGRSFATSQKIPQQVFSTAREQVIPDLMEGPLAGEHLGTVALGIRHVLCAPLTVVRYRDRADTAASQLPIGVIYLDSREKGHLLSTASRSALETVGAEAAAAIESARLYREEAEKVRLEHELRLAADIQRALLPDADQSGAYFDVAAASNPCRAIGGDFFDYFHLPNGAFGFALGDVAGKGPPAALLTAMIQGVLSSQVVSAASPAQLMTSLNATLIRRSIQDRFATLLYGALSPDGRLIYSNAGHNPPMLLRCDGVQRLETGGLIVGLFAQASYNEETLQLEDGDVLVVFSDGVTEAFNAAGEEFGETRLLACLEANRRCGPADLLRQLLSSVQEFTATAAQSDDVTALVLKYKGQGAGT
ncbi:MAG: SpoIIE family protein phosphatase [Vicinamibacterales bacterium]|nr:SpoIIE family protein phosphatase [Vicinamibacterales bacterium]